MEGNLEPIAIVGIGCRFPGAETPQAFWSLLCEGRDAIREVPADRWKIDALYDPDPTKPGKMMSRWGGFINGVDQFDWHAFRMLPREVKYMDPQHRLLLEVAWEALEDAGLPFSEIAGSRTSVSIGIGWSDYLRLQSRDWSQLHGHTITGNASGFAANRISYVFDLKGSSVSLDAGCTSSLSAIHLACQSLWTQECTMALAGGVSLMISPDTTIMVSKAGLLSPQGRCKTLDANADGFVRGEGAGVIILKPLSQVKPSDRVYALIRAISVNHNGHNKWIVAPSLQAQEELLQDVYRKADIDAAEIDYVELNGTGFAGGDAIETQALGTILNANTKRERPCMIGSVKTNIGHLEAAAGIASVIKVALSLYHREIPPTLNLQTINPAIPLQSLNLEAQRVHTHWPEKEGSPLAGVTTLSITGANSHMILSGLSTYSTIHLASESFTNQVRMLPLSARSKEGLYAQATVFRDFLLSLETTVDTPWRDICYTASVRRTHHEYRLFVTGRSPQEAIKNLDILIQEQVTAVNWTKNSLSQQHKIVFIFGQQGLQRLIFENKFLMREAPFFACVKECNKLFYHLTHTSLLIEENNSNSLPQFDPSAESAVIDFVFQLALATLWRSWGIIPYGVMGEGLGEIAAACTAGLLSVASAFEHLARYLGLFQEKGWGRNSEEPPLEIAKLPLYSADGGLYSEYDAEEFPWGKYLGNTNLSIAAIDHLLADDYDVFIEMGPLTALPGAVLAHLQRQDQKRFVLPSVGSGKENETVFQKTLGTIYTLGYMVDWSVIYKEEGKCVSVPTYSWQRERLWLDGLGAEEISTPYEIRSLKPSAEKKTHHDNKIREQSVEDLLVEMWAQVMGLEKVSSHDNFFELGGHSLLAMQLISEIQAMFQVAVPLSSLFQAPTPAACAAFILQNKFIAPNSDRMPSPLPLIKPDPAKKYHAFPLTEVQQAYWVGRSAIFEIGNVGNHGYIEVEAVNLKLERFEKALQYLIERHDMLRAILLPDGQQQILEYVPPFVIKVIDLRGQDPFTKDAQLKHIRHIMDHQILHVELWPAFEIYASCLDDYHMRLHLSIEALFVDAWSLNTLIQDFVHFYHEPDLPLPPLDLSFRDYILALEELRHSTLYRQAQEYWQQRLPSLPPAPDLPLAHKSSLEVQSRFVHREGRLDRQSWQFLKARVSAIGLTPSCFLLSAFAEILTTWSRTPHFSINLSTFNRLPLHPDVKSIAGDFTSLLILEIDNSVPDSFENRARRVQEQLWKDLEHSYYSGVHVLQALARAQNKITKAIMPIVFTSLLTQENSARQYPPPWENIIYCVSQTPQVWLDHQVLESDGELLFHWQSVDTVFPAGLVDTMFDAYCKLLQFLATDEKMWHDLIRPIVPQQHVEQCWKINSTDAPVSENLLHTLFFDQALQFPEHVAVISHTRKLTYKQVCNGMQQLASQLLQWGVLPNQLVAVVMEKGWEQVVGVLGILQSGAAYLPIDPTLPKDRLQYLLKHGEVQIALTQSWIDTTLQWPQHIRRICVDSLDMDRATILLQHPVQRPDDLAYVIYTSGSTGLPKGVMIDHRGAVNTILDINQRFGINSKDRVLAISSLSFDLSVYDIFGMLAAGGAIVLPTGSRTGNLESWLEMFVQERVTVWNSVPALLQIFLEYIETRPEALKQACLRLVLLSGDWIPVQLPNHLRKDIPQTQVVSLGGATEASIWSILYPISSVEYSWRSIPYGKPMFNQRFFVLDTSLELCPTWVPGQLYIGGIGLAKGYWRDEEKTRGSFIYHPRTKERLYQTGDLGRYLPDGNIEFLGREDFQVKILGHRIELGEIEESLVQHPLVQAAVATVMAEISGDGKHLVAYVVLRSEPDLTTNSVVQLLTTKDSTASLYDKLQRLEIQFGQANIRKDMDKPTIDLAYSLSKSSSTKKYKERLSYRQFLQEPISFEQFGNFLGVLRQIELEGLHKYLYPSAGGIYPVQVYIYIKPGGVEGMIEGIYYYNSQLHQLTLLSRNIDLSQSIHAEINHSPFDQSAFSLFFIGVLTLITSLYGDAARDFCLLEAGYMGQLLMSSASEYFIGLCPVGDLDFTSIRDSFALEENHVLLHSMLGGRVDPTMSNGWSFPAGNLDIVSFLPPVQPSSTSGELLHFLEKKLPDYMIPSSLVILEALPLTPNGKVDRTNLPQPEFHSSKAENAYVAPRSRMEQLIAAVWQEVLPTQKVGIHDNFFDLGGDSLLMVRAYTKLCKVLNQQVSMTEMFFQYPTIQSLVESLLQRQVPLSPSGDDPSQQQSVHIENRKKRYGSIQQERQARLSGRSKGDDGGE